MLAAALIGGALVTAGGGAQAAPTVSRIAGADRYATAAAVSQATFQPGAAVAFVVTGVNYPDALAGGPAAAKRGGPVLLTERDRLPSPTSDELQRLQPKSIVVLGGPSSVSDAVASSLKSYTSGSVTRVAGNDRFETAAAVSKTVFAAGTSTVYVANGGVFADALAGGPAAGVRGGPLLLLARDTIPSSTSDELHRLAPTTIVVLGGESAVSAGVEQQLRSYAGTVRRVQGGDRYDTSVAVSSDAFASGASTVYLATGTNFPDALAAGSPGGVIRAPLLLVGTNCVPPSVNGEIDRLAPSKLVILGGTGAVGPGVESRTPCPSGAPAGHPVVSPSSTPAWNDDGPDPDVVKFGTTYYAYTTGTTWGNHIGVLVSDNPTSGWRTTTGRTFGSTALPNVPGWQQTDTQTSPGVFFWGNRYVMFYNAIVKANGKYCLSVATSSSPTGPFQDSSSGSLMCQANLGGSIDPMPFVDTDGRPWLHWKNNDGSTADVSKVWTAPLAADGVSLAGPAQEVLAKDSVNYPWETTVDNPQMILIDGHHYLFFSGGDWQSDAYVVGYAICDGPQGPCTQPSKQPILGSYGNVAGPAGGTALTDGAGHWWLSYHAWTKGCTNYSCGGKRKLYVAPMSFE